jgi:uncharacterized GH25 family protein
MFPWKQKRLRILCIQNNFAMMKRLLVFLTLLIVSFLANSQEFWLQPSKFYYNPTEKLVINFMEGVDFIGESWEMVEKTDSPARNKTRVKKVDLHQKGKITDIRDHVGKDAGDDLVLPPQVEGTYMVVMETTNAFSDHAAEKFNDYLKEAALDEAYAHRQKTNSLDKNGKELYAHFAKLLVQVGKKPDDIFKKEARLTVEVIPQQNPSLLKVGDRVQFKVMYDGKPVFGARVKVWNRHNHRISIQNIFSEQNGMIETHISNPGTWMVSFVKMIPSKDPKGDWQSYKGSLVFGIQK